MGHTRRAAGVTPLYLVRYIPPHSCGIRDRWVAACLPPEGAQSAAARLQETAHTALFLPSPLQLLVAPAAFAAWFPGSTFNAADSSAKGRLWQRFKNVAPMNIVAAVATEGACALAPWELCVVWHTSPHNLVGHALRSSVL